MKAEIDVEANPDASSRLTPSTDAERCKAINSKKYQAELKRSAAKSYSGANVRLRADTFRALSAEVRLKMMYALVERELCECEIMAALDLTQSTASHHLSILERAGLVKKVKRGKWVFYQATDVGAAELR